MNIKATERPGISTLAATFGVPHNQITLIGSRRICPEYATGDWDYLCLVHDIDAPALLGFEKDPDDERYSDNFVSWRKHDMNLIVTTKREFYIIEKTIALSAMIIHNHNKYGKLVDMTDKNSRDTFHGQIFGIMDEYLK